MNNKLNYYRYTINDLKQIEYLKFKYNLKKADYIVYKGLYDDKYCIRCGNKSLVKILDDLYCNNCLEFGKVNLKTYFFQLLKINMKYEYEDKLDELKLTSKQILASKYIISGILNNSNILIHAVCGAGKTEITFNSISYFLKKNKIVAFAIPRIDILYEIKERLSYYFPKTKIAILNSKEEKIQSGQIYVLTTNQIIKFKKCFSLVIVDEIDAFPFEYNFKFNYGVEESLENGGIYVYLTSTPSKNILKKKLKKYVINRRWHNFLLPVPIFEYFDLDKFIKKKGRDTFLKNLEIYLAFDNSIDNNRRIYNKQVLLFMSNIKKARKFRDVLIEKLEIYKKKNNKNCNNLVKLVYASSEKRLINVEEFRGKKFPILITTTILERGITFENIDVIVMDTSSSLYTKSALIQIAGRVNRKKEFQNGKVIFKHIGITKEMLDSKVEIEKLNE